jgi:cell pole-organizing protein PopZ
MVVEMLQPMLRQWLDQNMPRLVAAALKEQADRASVPDRNGNKA